MNRAILMSGAAVIFATLAGCSGSYPGSNYAASHGVSQTDATASPLTAGNPCPGTNEAGAPWRPGEYCYPGGR